jgi:hypothetical protein
MTDNMIPQNEYPDLLSGEFIDAPCSEYAQRQNERKGQGYAHMAQTMPQYRERLVPSEQHQRLKETRELPLPGIPVSTAQVRWLPRTRQTAFFFRARGGYYVVVVPDTSVLPVATIELSQLDASPAAGGDPADDHTAANT